MDNKHNVNADGQTHDQLQAACWKEACRIYHPFLTQRLHCIPNDMHAGNIARWKQYEALGVTPGVWDMVLHWFQIWRDPTGSEITKIFPCEHWFEFKVGNDELSGKQKAFKKRMEPIGHKFHVITLESQFQRVMRQVVEPTLHIAKNIWKEEYEQNGKKERPKTK